MSILKHSVVQIFTHPLFTAFSWWLNSSRMRAIWCGEENILTALGHTGHPSTRTLALERTGGLKYLTFLVRNSIELTAQLLLTDTLSRLSRKAGAVVTLQTTLTITGKHLTAGLPLLSGTHLAALAPVENERNSFWTGWHRALALT